MQPARFRHRQGFRAAFASVASLSAAGPVQASSLSSVYMSGAAPIAIAAGALVFGVAATVMFERWRSATNAESRRARSQLQSMRAELDLAQAVLEGMPEVTIRWSDSVSPPNVFGPVSIVLPPAPGAPDIMDFRAWLDAGDAEMFNRQIGGLRANGSGFDLSLTTRDQRQIRATGRAIGNAAFVRLRPAFRLEGAATSKERRKFDRAAAEQMLALLPFAAWVRKEDGALCYINTTYRALVSDMELHTASNHLTEIFAAETVKSQLAQLSGKVSITLEKALAHEAGFDLVLFALSDGTAGFLRPRTAAAANPSSRTVDAELAHIGGVIDALHTPIAIFDGRRQLAQANSAYCELWGLERSWLKPGTTEQAILDRLRTLGALPAEVDYRAWRTEHLKSYTMSKSRETLWHLPDGRAINVIAVPASASGGVIYVFEDLTSRFELESRFKTLIQVQGETLNALNEAVAVFGTNGRLTLSNPRLSSLWKLPMNTLGQNPHIDEIGKACAQAMPDDGAIIWRDLKQSIVDLNPARADKTGRINRADGRLISYASIRLPDGQTLLTFGDVTESSNYQRVLKERNDALVTADKLKDAFVQNVSYELRSPLTNIIGFADILASGGAGELNEKQKSYTDYIRASSVTLGVLVDNILDLATVDAGVAELALDTQDIAALVDRAKAGLAATFSSETSQAPLNLEIDIAPGLPEFVADGTRIVQILYNLLANAARFSETGSKVRLTVRARGNDRIVFEVEDEGVGIPEEIKSAMFQRFEGHSNGARQRGPGLGLAIVRTFANLHGGTVSIEDRKPKGTRVTVNLPANAQAAVSAAE